MLQKFLPFFFPIFCLLDFLGVKAAYILTSLDPILHEFYLIFVVLGLISWSLCELYISVAADFDVPVWFEPVSVTKSERVAAIANYVSTKIFLL